MAGITPEGYEIETQTEIKTGLDESMKASFGQNTKTSEKSFVGVVDGIMSERLALLWELNQAIYRGRDPDFAEDDLLDAICALTGTLRFAARKSTVVLTATGVPATVLADGRTATVASTGVSFYTIGGYTIVAVSAWAPSTVYAKDSRVHHDSGKVYQAIVGGTSAGSGGPTGTGGSLDNTVTWIYLGDGTGAVDMSAKSVDEGPKLGVSRTITTIGTPVLGWTGVTNVLDAVPGRLRESNPDLRIRREVELAGGGSRRINSIRNRVLAVEDVTACLVFENTTMAVDGAGLVPKSIEVLALGGSLADSDADGSTDGEEAIAQAIFDHASEGIATNGATTVTVLDTQEPPQSHVIHFSRPTLKPVYCQVNLLVDASKYPSDGATRSKAAITAYGATVTFGKDVVASVLESKLFAIPGVLDAEVLISFAPTPTLRTTLAITIRELATYDTSRIAVASTPVTP